MSPKPRHPHQLVVVGTDTDVGKTVISALLVQGLGAHYWKPVQCGDLEIGGDTGRVANLCGLSAEQQQQRLLPEAYQLKAPASPNQAARAEGFAVDPSQLSLPPVDGPLVVETAGGLLVPLRDDYLQIQQIQQWQRPVLLVARSGLGTLNHTLLSLEALQRRQIPVLGLILNGPRHPANHHTLCAMGGTTVLAEVEPQPTLDQQALSRLWSSSGLAERLPKALEAWA
jgi:dethiobiotin synthetase